VGFVGNRANHWILLVCAALCGAALLGPDFTQAIAAGEQPQARAYPIASDARLAGDAKQTRFVLDLDRTVAFRAFTLADPYRLVVDIPQVTFRFPAGTGTNGRGLVRAFRYGLVMPGGSRIVFDLTGPAKITNSTMLLAANDQPPRLVLELEETDAASFKQALAAASRRRTSHQRQGRRNPSRRRIRGRSSSSTPDMAASTMAPAQAMRPRRVWCLPSASPCANSLKEKVNIAW
jgi:N-acetylmuramoyl-L-alanine amidase